MFFLSVVFVEKSGSAPIKLKLFFVRFVFMSKNESLNLLRKGF